jgi:hypothetical protein
MRRTTIALAAAQAALIAALAVALLGAAGVGALHSGAVPQFRQIVAAGPAVALVIENGPVCVPPVPLAACHTTVQQEFRVWLFAANRPHRILTYAWRK